MFWLVADDAPTAPGSAAAGTAAGAAGAAGGVSGTAAPGSAPAFSSLEEKKAARENALMALKATAQCTDDVALLTALQRCGSNFSFIRLLACRC
jgi:hypothetical protein